MRNAILLSMLVCAACSSSGSGKSGTGGNSGHDAGGVGSVDGSAPHDGSSGGGDDLSTASRGNDLAAPAGSDLAAPVGGGDLAVVSDLAIGHDIAFASPPDLTAGSNNSCPCPAGSYCDLATNSCVAGCVSDSDCPSNDYCDTTQRTCAPGCRTDNDCASPADACQSHVCGNQCGSCDDGNLCTNDSCQRNVCQHAATNEGGACPDDGSACTLDVCAAGVCTHPSGHDGAACSFAYDPCSAGLCATGSCQTQVGTCHVMDFEALESPSQETAQSPAADVDISIGTEPTGACHSLQIGACTVKVCNSFPNPTWLSGGIFQLSGALVPVSLTPDVNTNIYSDYINDTQPLFTATSPLIFVTSGGTAPPVTLPLAAAPASVAVTFAPSAVSSNGRLFLSLASDETMTWSYSGFPLNSSQVRLDLYAEGGAGYTQIDCFASPTAGKLTAPMAALRLLPSNPSFSQWDVSVETRATTTAGGYSVLARSAIYSSPGVTTLSY